MKTLLTIGIVALAAGLICAQERIDPAVAQKYARVLAEQAAAQPNLQLKFEADPEHPYGMKHEEVGALVIPAKQLAGDLKKVGKDVTPVGQLWLRQLTLVVKDQPVPNDKLRVVTINADGQDHPLPLFLLGARKTSGADLELVVYGPGKEPILVSLLKKVDVRQELPIEMEGEKGDNNRGTLTLTILGKYQAQLTLAKQD